MAVGPLARARLALLWEAVAPRLAPLLALGLGLVVAAATGLPEALPPGARMLVLAALAFAALWFGFASLDGFRFPGRAAVLRRVENDSGLVHRPLTSLADAPASVLDPASTALWAAHRQRLQAGIGRLSVVAPREGLLSDDRFGWRAGLILVAIVSVAASGPDRLRDRLLATLAPAAVPGTGPAATGFDLWLTPPAYTGAPPVYLGAGSPPARDPIKLPVGTTILARVRGGEHPILRLDGAASALAETGQGEFTLSAPLGAARHLDLGTDTGPLASLDLVSIPDQPPTATFSAPVAFAPRGSFRVAYVAGDDYGVVSLTLSIARADGKGRPLDLPLPAADNAKTIRTTANEDLTESPWAGSEVDLTIVAADAIGQTASSSPMRIRLPERIFHDPTAARLAALRKLLLKRPRIAPKIAEALMMIAAEPASYRGDTLVFLALRSAGLRLADHAPGREEASSVAHLLWDTALRLEDGAAPEALKGLRQAEQALRDALDRNAPADEIARLMQEFQQAMDRYVASLATEPPSSRGGTAPNGTITQDQLRQMQQQLRDLARTGAHDAARDALARLEDLLESLKAGRSGSGGQGQADSAMRGLMRQQQELLDRAYRAGQGQSGGKSGGDDPNALAEAQGTLRQKLGEALRGLGEHGDIPGPFADADRSMREAEDALRKGDTGAAVASQGKAMEALRQGAREMAERSAKQSGDPTDEGGDTDPFGRPGNSINDAGDVSLPTEGDIQQSREILDELRRRAAEPARPVLERDYIDRLLDRF